MKVSDRPSVSPSPTRRFPSALTGLTTFIVGLTALFLASPARAIDVLTQHNDQFRSGSNLRESTLTAAKVNVNGFGKLFSYSVDGQVYAQPLYVENLSISGSTHNVVYVATMEDSVYAFDADKNTTYWQVKFTGGNIVPVPITDITHNNNLNIHGNVGILSTPVIDRNSNTLYVLARTKNTSNNSYHHTLHALDLATGAEKFGGPAAVTASGFDARLQSQRPALGLSKGNIYLCFGSHEDIGPYHGWMMAYSASTLKQVAVFNTTPGGNDGAVWQSGQGPSFDADGNVYVITGNGDWNGTSRFGSSFIKLSANLRLLDYFTPADYQNENARDNDLGASGALLLPGSGGYPSTQYVIGGGKIGRLFVLDKNDLGQHTSNDSGAHQNWQVVQTSACSHHLHSSAIYWNSSSKGQLIYLWGENDVGKAFKFNGSTFGTSPAMATSVKSPQIGCGMPGGFLSISASGGSNGILWANCVFSGDALHNIVPGVLRAFNADNLDQELWNSEQNASRDDIGNFAKYVAPTISNGKVYMATFSNRVNVYGLLGTPSGGGGGGGGATGKVANGTYSIRNRASGKLLDNLGVSNNADPVGQWSDSNSNNQKWVVANIGGENYKISCVTGGKFLDDVARTAEDSAVGQWASSGSTNQQWTVSDLGGGFYKITNVANGKCLDTNGATGNGGAIVMSSSTGNTTQQWQFVAP